MKKILNLGLTVLAIVVLLTGCGSSNLSLSTTEVIEKVYENVNIEFALGENIALDKENMAYYLGVDNLEIEEGHASEAMTGSIPHSVVVVKLKDGEDVEAAKKAILDNADARKWICVEADQKIVENIGNTIILIMTKNELVTPIQENFKNLNN